MFIEIRDIRCEAAEVLEKLGDERGIAALLALCRDKDVTVRNETINSLGMLGDEREARPYNTYTDTRPYSESESLRNLDEMFSKIRSTLISVCENKRETAYIRCAALTALGSIGEAHPMVIAALNSLLLDSEKDVRRRAAQILGKFGQADEATLENFYQDLENDQGSSSEDWDALWVSSRALRAREVESWIQTQDA